MKDGADCVGGTEHWRKTWRCACIAAEREHTRDLLDEVKRTKPKVLDSIGNLKS
jgi:hypothetical protein